MGRWDQPRAREPLGEGRNLLLPQAALLGLCHVAQLNTDTEAPSSGSEGSCAHHPFVNQLISFICISHRPRAVNLRK